jgi:hypothetical protein
MSKSYNEGDVIVYRPFGGGTRVVLVDEKESDIKNGRPGFAGSILMGEDIGMGVWGYDDQIVEVRG